MNQEPFTVNATDCLIERRVNLRRAVDKITKRISRPVGIVVAGGSNNDYSYFHELIHENLGHAPCQNLPPTKPRSFFTTTYKSDGSMKAIHDTLREFNEYDGEIIIIRVTNSDSHTLNSVMQCLDRALRTVCVSTVAVWILRDSTGCVNRIMPDQCPKYLFDYDISWF